MELRTTITSSPTRALLNCIMLLHHFQQTICEIHVEASVKGGPVKRGEVLAYHCKIDNLQQDSGYNVKISRIVGSPPKRQVLSYDGGTFDNLDDRIFIASRQHQSDGSISYLLSITNIDFEDQGQYECSVETHTEDEEDYKERAEINIEYFPSDNNLQCSNEDSLTVHEGDPLTLNCSTDKGNPPVDIQWTKIGNTDETLQANSSQSDSTVFSSLNISTSIQNHDAYYICQYTSREFPLMSSKQCIVGPIKIIPSHRSTSPEPSLAQVTVGNVKTLGQAECDSSCSTHPSTLYWIAGGVVAGIIAIMLFIGDILLIVKLRQLRCAWGDDYKTYSFAPSVATETNYMYLPRTGSALEGNRMYMTLERTDPQQSNYHYSEEIYRPPTPMHYAISPTLNDSYTESHV